MDSYVSPGYSLSLATAWKILGAPTNIEIADERVAAKQPA